MVYLTKGELFLLLEGDGLALSAWLISSDPDAVPFKFMLENTNGLIIDSSFFQNQLVPVMIAKGAVSQAGVDRINAHILVAGAAPSFGVD